MPDHALDPERAAGLLGEAIDGAQTETGSFADQLGGEERLDDLADDVGWNAAAGVFDGDDDIVARREIDENGIDGAVVGPHGNRAPCRHGIARVEHQVHERQLRLAGIYMRRPYVVADKPFEAQEPAEDGRHEAVHGVLERFQLHDDRRQLLAT